MCDIGVDCLEFLHSNENFMKFPKNIKKRGIRKSADTSQMV